MSAKSCREQMQQIVRGLFDHIVGAAEQGERNGEAERLGSFQVDNQLNFRDLLDWQVGRLLARENPAGVDAGLPEGFRKTASVAHQTASRGELAKLIDSGYRVTDRQRAELFELATEE